ncbi:MAG: hypothetical protein ACON5F_14845 [Jejuia sp.]
MELVFEPQTLETEPEQETEIVTSLGFLNSQYKCVAQESLKSASSKSVFGIRRLIKNRRYRFTSSAEVLLKISTFFTAIAIIFA